MPLCRVLQGTGRAEARLPPGLHRRFRHRRRFWRRRQAHAPPDDHAGREPLRLSLSAREEIRLEPQTSSGAEQIAPAASRLFAARQRSLDGWRKRKPLFRLAYHIDCIAHRHVWLEAERHRHGRKLPDDRCARLLRIHADDGLFALEFRIQQYVFHDRKSAQPGFDRQRVAAQIVDIVGLELVVDNIAPLRRLMERQIAGLVRVKEPTEENEYRSNRTDTLHLNWKPGQQPAQDGDRDDGTQWSNDERTQQATKISRGWPATG